MGNLTQGIRRALRPVGVDPLQVYLSLKGLPIYVRNYRRMRAQLAASGDADFKISSFFPMPADRFDNSGVANGQYFHQDLLVANLVHEANPRRHVDVGSRVDGFVAHVAAFREIEVFDIRPLRSSSHNIIFRQADLCAPDFTPPFTTDSLSCLHTLEHFGLGRYGDPVDLGAYLRGWSNLGKLLEPGGTFYFSTPIGPQRIEFDAHRVFSIAFLRDRLMKPGYDIRRLWYVDDLGDLHGPVSADSDEANADFGCTYGCAIFELVKRP